MERHLKPLVAVAVVHEVDDVERVDVERGQPLEYFDEPLHHLVVVQVFRGYGIERRGDLLAGDFVTASVDGVQQRLRQVGARPEELHLLADAHSRHAAGDAVIVAPELPHEIVVLVLDGALVNGHPGAVPLEVLRHPLGPQHRDVGLGRGAEVVKRVQDPEAGAGHQRFPVDAHAPHRLRDPDGVSREELVVFGRAQKPDDPELHDKVVDQLLRFRLGDEAALQVPLNVDIDKGRCPPDRHRRAVLLLGRGEVRQVQPLDGLLRAFRGPPQVEAVRVRHLPQLLERADLLRNLLPHPDHRRFHVLVLEHGAVPLLGLNQPVEPVQRHPAVVPDDAPPPVRVREPGDDC